MVLAQEIVEKIRVGDGLTDKELADAVKFFTDLEQSLRCLGLEYHLAWLPVQQQAMRLQDYLRERKRK